MISYKKITIIFLFVGVLFLQSCRTNDGLAENIVVIKGSDTMVNLSQKWAEEYMKTMFGSQTTKEFMVELDPEAQMHFVEDFYEEEFDGVVAALSSIIEPLMIVLIGGIIGMLMIALYMPIFSMGDAVG